MRLCILGGTGFLGRHLCEELHARALRAVTISRNPDQTFLSTYAPSVNGLTLGTTEAITELRNCTVLVHLATTSLPGIGWNEPAAEIGGPITSEVQLLQDFSRLNPHAHIIYASTGGQIYGPHHNEPIQETCLVAPPTAYALGKLVIEATLNLLSATEGNPVTILRLANPVGQWQLNRRHGFVSTVVRRLLQGESLDVFGEGLNVRDYFDADDFAKFLCDLVFTPTVRSGTFNIGSDRGLTEQEIIQIVSRVVQRPVDVIKHRARPFDIEYALLDSSRARKELGWLPTTSIEASIVKIAAAVLQGLSTR